MNGNVGTRLVGSQLRSPFGGFYKYVCVCVCVCVCNLADKIEKERGFHGIDLIG